MLVERLLEGPYSLNFPRTEDFVHEIHPCLRWHVDSDGPAVPVLEGAANAAQARPKPGERGGGGRDMQRDMERGVAGPLDDLHDNRTLVGARGAGFTTSHLDHVMEMDAVYLEGNAANRVASARQDLGPQQFDSDGLSRCQLQGYGYPHSAGARLGVG
jgi:hypothetical protein